jgi:hypothetical protein
MMVDKPYLKGVAGWLELLIVGLIVVGPFIGFGRMTDECASTEKEFPSLVTNAAWLEYKQLSWWVFALAAALSITAGYRLWKVHIIESVRFAVVSLWLAGPGSHVLYFVAAVISLGMELALAMLSALVGSTIASTIGAAIWTAYLVRSQRVRNTYVSRIDAP